MEHIMTIFSTLDIANLKVTFHNNPADAVAFADAHDHIAALSPQDLLELSGPVMVELYNATAADIAPNLAKVNKFSNKETGAKRLWANLEDLHLIYAERDAALEKARQDAAKGPADKDAWEKRKAANQPAKATDYPAPAKARSTGINLAPKAKAYPCKAGTKQALLVDLLFRPEGATMAELMVAMSTGKPWQEITVKSGLNWDMNKVKGYGIRTTKRGDADCYHLVLPAGMEAPHPHSSAKGASLIKEVRDWANTNYSTSYGASALIETFTDEELVEQFKSLAAAKRWAKLQDEAHQNAQA
jgi:hypothetical protein